MQRLAVLVAGTAAAVALIVGLRDGGKPPAPRPAALSPTTTPASASPSPSAPPPAYRTGRAAGPVVRTDYGVVQVAVVARYGRIVDVIALRLPDRDPMDVQISKPAARQLVAAVLQAQTTDVDSISGATYTSEGYLQSLQAALDKLR